MYFELPRTPFEYHGDAAKTHASRHPDHPNWSTLGDLGMIDSDGYLFLSDRKAFMIISGGVNIYPQEVENCMIMHESVADVAVFGLPDPEMGEYVHAVVQPVDGLVGDDALARELSSSRAPASCASSAHGPSTSMRAPRASPMASSTRRSCVPSTWLVPRKLSEGLMPTYERIRYETPDDHVARIVLARAEARNAQDRRMLYELNDAFDVAAQDEGIRVVILAADGPDFSSGHDLRDRSPMSDFEPVSCWGGFDAPGAEGIMAHEEEYFLGLCWRWRNFPKPTIAAVQGRAIAGGLMLIWPCDLIVASEDALFSDPVVAFGLNGHEFFVHAWGSGPAGPRRCCSPARL